MRLRFCLLFALLSVTAFSVIALSVTALSSTAFAEPFKSFNVGNSLTVDLELAGVKAMAAEVGYDLEFGLHGRCGSSLQGIWENPTDVCSTAGAFGLFGQALPNEAWDAITLQIYRGGTFADAQQSVSDFVNLALTNSANEQATYYIYTGWGPTTLEYEEYWEQPATGLADEPISMSRDFMTNVLDSARAEFPDLDFYMIDVGEVLFRLDQEMEAGAIAGFSDVHDLYRDGVHMTVDIGRFVAGTTAFATMFSEDPTGLAIPTVAYQPDNPLRTDDALRNQLQSIIWDVVSSNPERTGVVVVPEPSTVVLLGLGVIGLLFYRRSR